MAIQKAWIFHLNKYGPSPYILHKDLSLTIVGIADIPITVEGSLTVIGEGSNPTAFKYTGPPMEFGKFDYKEGL